MLRALLPSSLACWWCCCLAAPSNSTNKPTSERRSPKDVGRRGEWAFSSSCLLFFLQSTLQHVLLGEMRPDDKFYGKERKIVLQMDNCSFGALITTSKKRKKQTQQAIVHWPRRRRSFRARRRFIHFTRRALEGAQESRQIIYGRLLSFSMNLYTQSAFEMISPMKLVVAEDESNGGFSSSYFIHIAHTHCAFLFFLVDWFRQL